MLDILPSFIQDQIFLYLDYPDLENTREFQSEYIQTKTEFDDFKLAAKYDNLHNFLWLIEYNKRYHIISRPRECVENCSDLFNLVEGYKRPSNLEYNWYGKSTIYYDSDLELAAKIAIQYESHEVLGYILEYHPEIKSLFLVYISLLLGKNFKITKSLMSDDLVLDSYVYNLCIKNNNLRCMSWWYNNYSDRSPILDSNFTEAVKRSCEGYKPSKSIVKWMISKKWPIETNIISNLINYRWSANIETLDWMLKIGAEINSRALSSAIYLNYPEIINWLMDLNCPIDDNCYLNAIDWEMISLIKIFYERGYNVPDEAINRALTKGNKEIVEWILSKGIELNQQSMSYAISSGKLEIIKLVYGLNNNTINDVDSNRLYVMLDQRIVDWIREIDKMKNYIEVTSFVSHFNHSVVEYYQDNTQIDTYLQL